MPAFLFSAVAFAPGAQGVPVAFVLIAFGVTAAVTCVTWGIARIGFRGYPHVAAPLTLAAGYGNVGYLGVPIALSVLGEQAGLVAAVGQLIHNLMFMLGYPAIRAMSYSA